MSTPGDRLPYADCAYIEATLSGTSAGDGLGHAAPVRDLNDAHAHCPLCRRARPSDALSAEALDALQFRFWSDDHRRFDHIGFARAVLAACAA